MNSKYQTHKEKVTVSKSQQNNKKFRPSGTLYIRRSDKEYKIRKLLI